jgi:hypothetical protein
MLKKFFMVGLALMLVLAVYGCKQKGEEAAEIPQTEEVVASLAGWQQEVKGEMCTLKLSDLKIVQTIDKSTKEITGTPSLKGGIKILNHSDQILDIKELNVQYLDQSWNPIPFQDGKKKTQISFYSWDNIQPGEEKESALNVNVPKTAMKGKTTDVSKIRYEISYVPIPLWRETLDLSPNVEEK